MPALRLAIRLSGIESLALTKLDVLAGLDRVKICTAYRLGDQLLDEMPLDPDDLAAVQPVYEEHPGWPARSPASGPLTREEDLPAAARAYLARVAELSGLPYALVSIGPGREETLGKKDPFAPA
jgi:adenylosuccinate synthase